MRILHFPGGWTVVDRIARGEEIPVHGDGTSLWTLTHAEDFAAGLVGLLGNPRAIGEMFNITGDDVYTWDQIYTIFADGARRRAKTRARRLRAVPGCCAGVVLSRLRERVRDALRAQPRGRDRPDDPHPHALATQGRSAPAGRPAERS